MTSAKLLAVAAWLKFMKVPTVDSIDEWRSKSFAQTWLAILCSKKDFVGKHNLLLG
jgi:hypothetical protein